MREIRVSASARGERGSSQPSPSFLLCRVSRFRWAAVSVPISKRLRPA